MNSEFDPKNIKINMEDVIDILRKEISELTYEIVKLRLANDQLVENFPSEE